MIIFLFILIPVYSQYEVKGNLEVTGKSTLKDTIIAPHGIRFNDGTHQNTAVPAIDTVTKISTKQDDAILRASLNTKVTKSDSLVKYGTPKEISDTSHTLRQAIALKANLASPTFTGTVGGITQDMVISPLVTPGNRSRVDVIYSDTFKLRSDTILNGCNWTMIKGVTGDTSLTILSIEFDWKYRTAYSIGVGDSAYFVVKRNGANYKVIHFMNIYFQRTYGYHWNIPVAIDEMDFTSPLILVFPASKYTGGTSSGCFIIRYKKSIRKNT